MFEVLGMTGIAISLLAYVPQIVHLEREHCSAGVSRRAWAMWLAASLLIGALAVHRGDIVFIALQVSSLTSAATILFLAQRYRGMVCEFHRAAAELEHDHSDPRLGDAAGSTSRSGAAYGLRPATAISSDKPADKRVSRGSAGLIEALRGREVLDQVGRRAAE